MAASEITVGTDFTSVPGGRYRRYGPYSGEEFRETRLLPALRDSDHLTVYLDGTKSYMSSFLEEAFGGLIRYGYFTREQLKSKLTVAARTPRVYDIYIEMVQQFLDRAEFGSSDKNSPPQVA